MRGERLRLIAARPATTPENAIAKKLRNKRASVEMKAEYDFSAGIRGKYVDRYKLGTNVVLLEPEISKAFPDSKSVNEALRAPLAIAVGYGLQEPAHPQTPLPIRHNASGVNMPTELPLARNVAAKIHAQFPHTGAPAIEQMIDAAFWASLRREEGFTPTISLAYLTPEQSIHPILFDRRIPLDPTSLARLSPAVERPGIHLGVSPGGDGQLSVWGAIRALPAACFVLEVVTPGLLVIKRPGDDDTAKFANIAVLEGDQAKFLSAAAAAPPDSPPIINTLLGLDETATVLVELAVSMRKHRRGGALLVVPVTHNDWCASIVQPMAYQISAQGIPDVEVIAGLTAVDGATIITGGYKLLAFGAKITRREGAPRIDQVAASELIEGAEVQVVHPSQLGGTRHLSAAQFVQDQCDAVALVASQDGRFTVFSWSPTLDMVQALRVETFLL